MALAQGNQSLKPRLEPLRPSIKLAHLTSTCSRTSTHSAHVPSHAFKSSTSVCRPFFFYTSFPPIPLLFILSFWAAFYLWLSDIPTTWAPPPPGPGPSTARHQWQPTVYHSKSQTIPFLAPTCPSHPHLSTLSLSFKHCQPMSVTVCVPEYPHRSSFLTYLFPWFLDPCCWRTCRRWHPTFPHALCSTDTSGWLWALPSDGGT